MEQEVSIWRSGRIRISYNLYEQMGKPKAVIFFADLENNEIGLKPCRLNTVDSYKIDFANYWKLKSPIINLKRVLKIMFGDIPQGKKQASWNEKMLVICLDEKNDM